eukprot:TRINITY_DN4855_c0_g1_i1.p1 TRINITY_DN4855_c0_g1~~TRINITY_DN4855_c0_g1_i1.p1  ORF type:complete len:984 (-),score=390.17 TRINITY_DN4855_c0_g1_i1:43-2994(-)
MRWQGLLLGVAAVGALRVDDEPDVAGRSDDADPSLAPDQQAAATQALHAQRRLEQLEGERKRLRSEETEVKTRLTKAQKDAQKDYERKGEEELAAQGDRQSADKLKLEALAMRKSAQQSVRREVQALGYMKSADRSVGNYEDQIEDAKAAEKEGKADSKKTVEALEKAAERQRRIASTAKVVSEEAKSAAEADNMASDRSLDDSGKSLKSAEKHEAEAVSYGTQGDDASWDSAQLQVRKSATSMDIASQDVLLARAKTSLAEAKKKSADANAEAAASDLDQIIGREKSLTERANSEAYVQGAALKQGNKKKAKLADQDKEEFRKLALQADKGRRKARQLEKAATAASKKEMRVVMEHMKQEGEQTHISEKVEETELKSRQRAMSHILSLAEEAQLAALNQERSIRMDKNAVERQSIAAAEGVRKAQNVLADTDRNLRFVREKMDQLVAKEQALLEKDGEEEDEKKRQNEMRQLLGEKGQVEAMLKVIETEHREAQDEAKESELAYERYRSQKQALEEMEGEARASIRQHSEQEVQTKNWVSSSDQADVEKALRLFKQEAKNAHEGAVAADDAYLQKVALEAMKKTAVQRLSVQEGEAREKLAAAEAKMQGAKADKNKEEQYLADLEIFSAKKSMQMDKIVVGRTKRGVREAVADEKTAKALAVGKDRLEKVAAESLKHAEDREDLTRRRMLYNQIDMAQDSAKTVEKSLFGVYATANTAHEMLADCEANKAKASKELEKSRDQVNDYRRQEAEGHKVNAEALNMAKSSVRYQTKRLEQLKSEERTLEQENRKAATALSGGMSEMKQAIDVTVRAKSKATQAMTTAEETAYEQAELDLQKAKKTTKAKEAEALRQSLQRLREEGEAADGEAEEALAEEKMRQSKTSEDTVAAKEAKLEARRRVQTAEDDSARLGTMLKSQEKNALTAAGEEGEATVKAEDAALKEQRSKKWLAIYQANLKDYEQDALSEIVGKLSQKYAEHNRK